jgi:7,8-dihydroneopterin aldolase/epimerase/oxygenase
MSDLIEVKGIKVFGYHGVFESEKISGQDFYVDLTLELDLTKATSSDDVSDTVSYAELIDLVVSEVTGDRAALIERLAGRIGDKIRHNYPQVASACVTVHKPQAPVGAEVADISVTIKR